MGNKTNQKKLNDLIEKLKKSREYLEKDIKNANTNYFGNEMGIETCYTTLDELLKLSRKTEDNHELQTKIMEYKSSDEFLKLIKLMTKFENLAPPSSGEFQKKCIKMCGECVKDTNDMVSKYSELNDFINEDKEYKKKLKTAKNAMTALEKIKLMWEPPQNLKLTNQNTTSLDKEIEKSLTGLKTLVAEVTNYLNSDKNKQYEPRLQLDDYSKTFSRFAFNRSPSYTWSKIYSVKEDLTCVLKDFYTYNT